MPVIDHFDVIVSETDGYFGCIRIVAVLDQLPQCNVRLPNESSPSSLSKAASTVNLMLFPSASLSKDISWLFMALPENWISSFGLGDKSRMIFDSGLQLFTNCITYSR